MNDNQEEQKSMARQIYTVAVDIGSPLGRESHFGWADSEGNGDNNIVNFRKTIEMRSYFSLGIEAPLFVPLYGDLNDFTRAREFDGNRSWSVAAGAYTAAINLGFLARVLMLFTEKGIAITTDKDVWERQEKNCILIWEAFISRNDNSAMNEKAKVNSHIQDAKTALQAYRATIIIDTQKYLALPLALAKQIGLEVLDSPKGIVVIGNKE